MAHINVGNFPDLETALKVFKTRVSKEGILRELRRHEFHLKPSERRNQKHRDAVKRLKRRDRIFRLRDKDWKPRTFRDELLEKGRAIPEPESAIGTALAIVTRKSRGEIELATIEDREKGAIGFITGSIMPGNNPISVASREIFEEVGFTPIIPESRKIFHEINVNKTSGPPYMMYGVIVKKFTGTLKEGEELVPGSFKWRTEDEILCLIERGKFLRNHAPFFFKFLEDEDEEKETKKEKEEE